MPHLRPGHLVLLYAISVLLLFSAACEKDRHPDGENLVWFVQLTDPHFFLDTSKDADAAKKSIREKQEKLDQGAVADFWKQVPSLQSERAISFLVVTGDLGIEPCSIADLPATNPPQPPKAKDCLDKVNKDKRTSQINALADLFGNSPVRDIYVVAGNNDIASETAADEGVAYFDQFVDELQKKIDAAKKNVQLHDLTRCYATAAAASSCYLDVADMPYRLIGFPSYSFKNREPGSDANSPLQEKQFETFRTLLDQARQSGKKVLVVSHIPLIDDPFTLAQDRYAGIPAPQAIDKDPKNSRSTWSTWNVSKKVLDDWEDAISSDVVAGVLAGHLHDSHKEIYRPPYQWSSVNDPKTGFSKLYLAPPLSVKNQDTSPIQARGFSLVGLSPEEIRYRIYWYDAEKGDFAPDHPERFARDHHRGSWGVSRGRIAYIVACVWQYLCPTTLEQSAILFIALLAAFLTVVQIWQIPAPDGLFKSQTQASAVQGTSTGTQTTTTQTTTTQTGTAKAAFETSPFASNFGKTVITGLGGLIAETVLKSFEGDTAKAGDKQFYIVWFILLFFVLLIFGSLLRALVEAVRARIAIIHYPLSRTPRANRNWLERSGDWISYWFLRIVHWIFSLKVPLLTLLDTFTNLIQGKNETITRVFSDTIIDQQRNVIRVAHAIRRQMHEVILRELMLQSQTSGGNLAPPTPQDVRIGISVLSADQTKVYYIARSPGSSIQPFAQRSVAWISVFTGKIRWFKRSYREDPVTKKAQPIFDKIVLFDNTAKTIPDMEGTIYLKSNYQSRDDDYEAFVIFPVPWPQRGFGSRYVKGGIHISFRHQEQFEAVWNIQSDPVLDTSQSSTGESGYRFEAKMLDDQWCPNPQIRASLREAVAILGELLYGFNENIYFSSPVGAECPE